MVVVVNALLYVLALSLSLAVLMPSGAGAPRRVRLARWVLGCGGGLAMAVAITLSFMGRWFESGIAGCASVVIVSGCLCYALASGTTPDADDEDEGEDGGGEPRRRPRPPAPPQPAGGPPGDLWTEFDRARADWDGEREPVCA